MGNGELLFSTVPIGDGDICAPVFPRLIASKGIEVHPCRRDLIPARYPIAVEAPDPHSRAGRFEVMAVEPGIGSLVIRLMPARFIPGLFFIVSSRLYDPAQERLRVVEPFGSPIKFQFKLSLTQTEHAICPGEQKDFVAVSSAATSSALSAKGSSSVE